MELLVEAVLGVLVVTLDGLKGVVGVNAVSGHLLHELLDGVGLVVGRGGTDALDDASLGVLVPTSDDLLGGRGLDAVLEVDAAAEGLPGVLRVGIVGVPHGEGGLLGKLQLGDGAVGEVGDLVLVTLAVNVEVDTPEVGDDAVGGASGATVDHGSNGEGLLPSGADPQAHLLAVAGHEAVVGELGVVVNLVPADGVLEPLVGHGAVASHEVAVLGEVARGEHDGLGGLVLDVVAVGVLGNNGAHAAGVVVVTDEVEGAGVVVDLAAEVLGEDLSVGLGLDGGTPQSAEGLLVTVEVVRCGRHVDDAVGIGVAGLQAAVQALALHELDGPVDGLSGVVDPAGPLLLVHKVGAGGLLGLHDLAGELGVVLDTLLHLILGADGVVGATAAHGLGRSGEEDDVGALLGSGDGGAHAGHACTHDDDVVRDGLGNLILRDGVGSDLEAPLGALELVGGHGLLLVGHSDTGKCAHGGDAGSGGPCTLDKLTTVEFHVGSPFNLDSRPAPQGRTLWADNSLSVGTRSAPCLWATV